MPVPAISGASLASRYYKTINIAWITSCGNTEASNIIVLVTSVCIQPRTDTLGNIYAVNT